MPENEYHHKPDKSRKTEVTKNKEGLDENESLDELSPDIKNVMEFGMSMQRFSGPLPNPIASKINENHIDKILEIAEKDNEREYYDTKSGRNYTLIYILIFVALFVFLTIYLIKDNRDLFMEILKIVAIFAGGFGSGYGIKAFRESKKE